jgi:hypothetical protein
MDDRHFGYKKTIPLYKKNTLESGTTSLLGSQLVGNWAAGKLTKYPQTKRLGVVCNWVSVFSVELKSICHKIKRSVTIPNHQLVCLDLFVVGIEAF